MRQDLTSQIVREPEFEKHFGVELVGLFAHVVRDNDGERLNAHVAVNGEVRALDGVSLPRSLHLVASLHDGDGRVLAVMREAVEAEGFHGYQAFSMSDYRTLPGGDVARIKIYPQGAG